MLANGLLSHSKSAERWQGSGIAGKGQGHADAGLTDIHSKHLILNGGKPLAVNQKDKKIYNKKKIRDTYIKA